MQASSAAEQKSAPRLTNIIQDSENGLLTVENLEQKWTIMSVLPLPQALDTYTMDMDTFHL